ncbi:DUF2752 domain-containing protein [Candidatus Pacearchaeota archaeon]|nr:DUF2752 domain-containing protein [Candidatus Pacearchaeota archaeon]MBI2056626.1 DUF2752 domain-containing protein [Candidatus Pacearchaeota archaeon]
MDRKIKNISSRILTLSYPKYRFFVFLIVLILLALLPMNIVAKTHDLSICSKTLGKYCYSVGITRGVSSLLKGNFSQAIEYNFLSIPTLIILLLIMLFDLRSIFKKKE